MDPSDSDILLAALIVEKFSIMEFLCLCQTLSLLFCTFYLLGFYVYSLTELYDLLVLVIDR